MGSAEVWLGLSAEGAPARGAIAGCIDTCQYRWVPMYTSSSLRDDDPLACCIPLSREPISTERAAQVAPLLKALADPVRLRLLSLVQSYEGGEACVCDLLSAFELSQPTISHHLKLLHEVGLLDREKRGTWVYYSARPEALAAVMSLFDTETSPVAR